MPLDEKEEMRFVVDIPHLHPIDHTPEWETIEYFDTKEEAIEYARNTFGADDKGMVSLISEV